MAKRHCINNRDALRWCASRKAAIKFCYLDDTRETVCSVFLDKHAKTDKTLIKAVNQWIDYDSNAKKSNLKTT